MTTYMILKKAQLKTVTQLFNMSKEILVKCLDCDYTGPHEIWNDWFDNEFPFCPNCCKELTYNPDTNDYR